jgi:FdhD protein
MTSANDSSLVRPFSIQRFENGRCERAVDTVAVEEPLEIRLSYWFKDAPVCDSLAVTMRTPGQDRELAAGFLLSEGIIRSCDDLIDLRSLGAAPSNEIIAEVAKTVDVENWKLGRSTLVSSSCGICGKRSRETLSSECPHKPEADICVSAELIETFPDLLRQRQTGFAQTGGLHAACLVTATGVVESAFEDIGRHNALDKLLGDRLLRGGIPLGREILFLSSRGSFELVQKAAMGGASVLATVGGPSSLAIEAARDYGITLIGFVRAGRFNVYSGEWRIEPAVS